MSSQPRGPRPTPSSPPTDLTPPRPVPRGPVWRRTLTTLTAVAVAAAGCAIRPAAPAADRPADTDQDVVVATLPVGDDGVTLQPFGEGGTARRGPCCLAVDRDGGLWVGDTYGVRLWRVSADGTRREAIALAPHGFVSVTDMAVGTDGVAVFGPTQGPSLGFKLLRLARDGAVLGSIDLPDWVTGEGGLVGVNIDDGPGVVLAMQGGRRLMRVERTGDVQRRGAIIDGYSYGGRTYGIDWDGTVAVRAGDRRWVLDDDPSSAVATLLGVAEDGSVWIEAGRVRDVAGRIDVVRGLIHVAPDGRLLGLALAPDDSDVEGAAVFAVGADGRPYALVTRTDGSVVVRLAERPATGDGRPIDVLTAAAE